MWRRAFCQTVGKQIYVSSTVAAAAAFAAAAFAAADVWMGV